MFVCIICLHIPRRISQKNSSSSVTVQLSELQRQDPAIQRLRLLGHSADTPALILK